jgi:hypothetical protein
LTADSQTPRRRDIVSVVDVQERLESLLTDARSALAALNTSDRTVAGLVDRVAARRDAGGTLVGFLDALVATNPNMAARVAPQIESFVGEAIAARMLLD